jgi:hypothetical protein
MKTRTSTVLALYRNLLRLYPRAYRNEYEEEMLQTMESMLADASTRSERAKLLWRACTDYVISLTRQNVIAFEDATPGMPHYVKQSSLLSTSLVLPFFIICTYNCITQYILKHSVPLARLEAKTWVIYCILLPSIAFGIVMLAGIKNLQIQLQRNGNELMKRHGSITYDWILLSIPVALVVTIALL